MQISTKPMPFKPKKRGRRRRGKTCSRVETKAKFAKTCGRVGYPSTVWFRRRPGGDAILHPPGPHRVVPPLGDGTIIVVVPSKKDHNCNLSGRSIVAGRPCLQWAIATRYRE